MEGLEWFPITGESSTWLDHPFIEEEVRLAVFQLNKDKALCLDGFTIAVYKERWDVMKEAFMMVVLEFHNNGVINQITYATFIALMPKKVKTLKISDFKPINLFTSLYKIITKVLSRRLRRVLHETIHISHPSFFFTLISTSFVFGLKKKKLIIYLQEPLLREDTL